MKKLIVLFVFAFLATLALGQRPTVEPAQNVIRVSASNLGPLVLAYSLDYERMLMKRGPCILHAEAGWGKFYENSGDSFSGLDGFSSVTTGFDLVVGRQSHRFEFDLGVRYSFIGEEYDYGSWRSVSNIGYRYQHPEGRGLVFRAYLGSAGIGISVGKAF